MRRTKSGLPRYCAYNRSRHGKQRVRFRKDGHSAYLKGIPWGEEFMRAYAAALEASAGVPASHQPIGATRTLPGSIDALVIAYYASSAFRNLRESTQKNRRLIIEAFRRQHGTKPVSGLTRMHIDGIISAKRATPDAANSLLAVLRVLLGYAVDIGLIASNPTIGLKAYKRRGDGFHAWSEGEAARFRERHPTGSKARLALELLLGTAQRRGDVVKLGRQHVQGDCIAVRQSKTGAALLIPMHPNLIAELKLLPPTQMTFLVKANGAPYLPGSFGAWFRTKCNEAGLPQCSAHGLRKLAATQLAHAGASASEIAAVTGHKTLSEVAHYTASADQARLARAARIKQLGAEQNETADCPTSNSPLSHREKKQ
jgi:integrase